MPFILLYIIFITPVTLDVTLRHDHVTDITAALRVWNIPRHFRWRSHRDRQGRHIFRVPDRPGQPLRSATPGQEQRALVIIGAVLRSDKARRFLLRHLHMHRARVLLRLGLGDAARTAALAGLAEGILRTLARRMPGRVSGRAEPDFLANHTRAQIRCILSFRLGTILITAAMVLTALALEKREHTPARAKEAV